MKLLNILFTGLLFTIFTGVSFGQDLKYSVAESLFNENQNDLFKKAEVNIERGDKYITQADEIEEKYQKFKSKKAKKYDKKTWEAKRLKIQAERSYLKAYEQAVTIYSEIITAAEFYDDDDRVDAQTLSEDAVSLITQSESKMDSYNKNMSNTKELKKISSSGLNSAINSAKNLRESAIDKQKKAIDLVLAQGPKKEENERDDRAWQNAQDINTIASYQAYIDDFPSGKYVSDARQMIRQLQAEEDEKNKMKVSNYVFKVQIGASKSPLPNYELASRYSNTKEIEKVYTDYYYKYRVGNFSTYAEAAVLKDRLLRSTVPDAFIVVFDKTGNQIEVTDEMKK